MRTARLLATLLVLHLAHASLAQQPPKRLITDTDLFRFVSVADPPLLRDVFDAFANPPELKSALEASLVFLASESGRTDANCSVTDMGGTLHDAIHAPNIARTFEATPEQLLHRVRALR